ncbi:MAG: CAAX prenyl protease-related protein [Acidobacteria bacterium]|nr:CAAX prenyl protease-related protein [Acidobacteriota bacterium]
MLKKVQSSPVLSRVVPFAAFALLTLFQGQFGENSQYWIYALKTGIGAWLLWLVRPYVMEMRWKISWEAVVAGVVIFLIWIGLDGFYPMLAKRTGSFDPNAAYGAGSALALFFIAVRIAGSSLVVPPLEEVFYRSFIYRYIQKSDFLKIPLSRFHWKAFLITGIIFGIAHYEWIQGIICAFAYQGLVIRKNRLGDAICAHAVTNFLLGLYVIFRNAYIFW